MFIWENKILIPFPILKNIFFFGDVYISSEYFLSLRVFYGLKKFLLIFISYFNIFIIEGRGEVASREGVKMFIWEI